MGVTLHRSVRAALLDWRIAITILAVVIAAGSAWWLSSLHRPPVYDSGAESRSKLQPASNGSVSLSTVQLRAQGIEYSEITEATELPVNGLPAQAIAALASSAQVVAPYAGVVVRILLDEGATAGQGQALAVIRSRDVLAAQSELVRARSEAMAAAQQARRDAALLAEGIIPAARNEQSQARNAAAQGALQQAMGALAAIRPVADGQAGDYELLAPLSGQVVRRHLVTGQAVAAFDVAFSMAKPGTLDLVISVPLRLRPAIEPGLPVRLPDGATARVVAVGADADPSSQTFRVRAQIEPGQQAGFTYVAGQQFSVSLLLPVPAGALSVPTSALLPAGQSHVLYVTEADDSEARMRIRAVAVHLLGGDENSSVVLPIRDQAGAETPVLLPGMRVVAHGTALLRSLMPLH